MGVERGAPVVLAGAERPKAGEGGRPGGRRGDPQGHQHVDRRRGDAPRPCAMGRRRERVQTGEVQGGSPRRVQAPAGLLAVRLRREDLRGEEPHSHGVQDRAEPHPPQVLLVALPDLLALTQDHVVSEAFPWGASNPQQHPRIELGEAIAGRREIVPSIHL